MLGLILYGLSNSVIFSLLILVMGSIFFYISRINNLERKENLNIIRDENKLYFYLSDDLLFSVKLNQNSSIAETLRESVHNELASLQDIIRKICFINFKEDKLLDELNRTFLLKGSL